MTTSPGRTSPDPGVQLCPAGAADLPVLLPLVAAYHAFEQVEQTEAQRRAALLTLLEDASLGRAWLIRAAGDIAGYVVVTFGYSVEFCGRDAFLDEFYVVESCRGRGIGKAALALSCEACRGCGVRALHLEVARGNAAAKSLYATLGFEDRERFQMMSLVL